MWVRWGCEAPPTSRKYQIIKLELDSPIIAFQGRDPQYSGTEMLEYMHSSALQGW